VDENRSKVLRIIYACADCRDGLHYLVRFGNAVATKVGQFPAPRPIISRELERALGESASLYRKASACEAEGFGVGAFAYYRAVVERLVESLGSAKRAGLTESECVQFSTDWQAAERDGSKRIQLVYDTLPDSLREGVSNPLDYLYSSLSAGLHGGDDEACMREAEGLRELLVTVLVEIQRAGDSRKATERAKALMKP